MASRWSRIGILFRSETKDGQYSGFIDFGLLGSISIMGFVKDNGTIELSMMRSGLPLNMLADLTKKLLTSDPHSGGGYGGGGGGGYVGGYGRGPRPRRGGGTHDEHDEIPF